jgi:serine/threonine protein phosphatase PrpC
MPLEVTLGHCSRQGNRAQNEDFVGMVSPTGEELARKGHIAVIADGVSGNGGGREAAEYCVRGLVTDYYATPDTWEPLTALDRVIQPLNRWVISQAQHRREQGGMATTLSALLLRGRSYFIAHVGDTRIYLLRGDKLFSCLTTDHVWDRPDMSHVLTRGIGLDTRITPDYADGALEIGDRFLLLSDGVWSSLDDARLQSALANNSTPEETATMLCDQAIAAGSQDNASAVVLHVVALPDDVWTDVITRGADLPPPPILKPGQELDGFRIDEVVHRSAVTVLYRVTDTLDQQRHLVLKTLTPERGTDPVERNQLLHESWIAKRAVARFFAQVVEVAPERRSALYYLQTWHAGATLGQWLAADRHVSILEALRIGIALTRAIGALHRRSILHRDIKPDNVHVGDDGETRLLDFGVAISGLSPPTSVRAQAGTPSFLAPELFGGAAVSPQTDLYAAGVTLYHLLTRKYPYGEIEPFQHPRFVDPISPARYRPDIPAWLENVILKAVAREPAQRFETAEEFLLALERGAARPIAAPTSTPLVDRVDNNKLRIILALSILANVILLYLLLVLSTK